MADEEELEEKEAEEPEEGAEGEGAEDGEGEEGAEGEGAPKKSSKKRIIILLAILFILLGGMAGALVYLGVIDIGGSSEEEEAKKALLPQTIFYDLDEFLVNLNNPGRQISFLKMTVTLELPNAASRSEIESNLPRVRDSFQVYLRELRNSDLQGSAGLHRLREELLLRINKIIAPEQAKDILFKEIVVQ